MTVPPEPLFHRVGESRLFWLEDSGRTIAWLLPPPADARDVAPLTVTWSIDGGAYLFLGAEPGPDEAFAARAEAYLDRRARAGWRRLVWIDDASGPVDGWRDQWLAVGSAGKIARRADFAFGQYRLVVDAGATVSVSADAGEWGFGFGTAPAATLFAPGDSYRAKAGLDVPMAGGRRGCWRFSFDVPSETDPTAFERLRVGLRYFWRPSHESSPRDVFVHALTCPVLHRGGDPLTLTASLDPVRPLEPDRSHLAFGTAAPALPTSLATARGYRVTLVPQEGGVWPASRLVFARAPVVAGADGDVPEELYLTPYGIFQLWWDAAEEALVASSEEEHYRLLCGASGVEYLGMPADTTTALVFYAGMPAFAAEEGPELLTPLGTTSWVAPWAGGTFVRYYAQPEQGALYAPSPGGGGFLDYVELPAAVLGDPSETGAFPIGAYRNLPSAATAAARMLEARALAPTRRARVAEAQAGAAPLTTVAVTTQGVAVGLEEGKPDWASVGLANDADTAASEPDLRFVNVHGPLRDAFQTNRLFMVLANATEFANGGSVPDGGLVATIAGWKFDLSPSTWTADGAQTLIVFKQVAGRSLRELTDDAGAWTWPAVAVPPDGGLADTQARLREIFAAAEAAYRETGGRADSPFAHLVEVIGDPEWSGIVAFGCPVSTTGLPADLQPLVPGIDAARFRAHHVGFETTPFTVAGGQLTFERTSMFGLVDYDDPEDQNGPEKDFAFKVLRLEAGFRNSELTSFSSRVELLINRLFGARAVLYPTDHGNNLVFEGVYQRQSEAGGATRASIVMASRGDARILLADSALSEVTITSAELSSAGKGAAGTGHAARFLLGGELHFHEPAGFDPFGFGSPVAAAEEESGEAPEPAASFLRFSNLAVDMTVAAAGGDPTFALVTEALSFDAAGSAPRPGALQAHFPLGLSGLVAPASGTTPDALGYVTVSTPLQQSTPRHPWFALVYELDLGGLGALAADSGLKVEVLVGWWAAETQDDPPFYLGIKLPGLGDVAGAGLPLQGVAQLGFRAVELSATGDGALRRYVMRFRDFGLRLLGLTLPPGHNDFWLFARHEGTGATKLAWYAAYDDRADPKPPASAVPRRSLS